MHLYPFKQGGRFGFINETGLIVIAAQFDYVAPFSEGRAIVMRQGEALIIDEAGAGIPCPERAWACHGSIFSEGLCVLTGPSMDGMYSTGVIDTSGQWVIEPKRGMQIRSFRNGLARVEDVGYIDRTGAVVLPLSKNENVAFQSEFSEGLASCDGGYMDPSGKLVIAAGKDWARMGDFSDGLAFVVTELGRNVFSVIIDRTGKEVFPRSTFKAPFYTFAAFSEGLALVCNDHKTYVLSKQGRLTPVPGRFAKAEAFSSRRCKVETAGDRKMGYINEQGEMVIEPRFAMAESFVGPLARVSFPESEGFYGEGYIDQDGRTVFDWKEKAHKIIEGRPLRVAGGVARTRITAPRTSSFIERARDEHASIAAFLRLGLELLAVGADSSLVARVAQAAAEEHKHTEMCLHLARKQGATDIVLQPLTEATAPIPQPTRAGIASQSLIDGCINEGRAAKKLREEALEADDEETRAILNEMADDEEAHALLAWDIVRAMSAVEDV